MDIKTSFKWIKSTFLRLTSKTYPYGHEDELVESMIKTGLFPKNIQKDASGNYFYKIGNSRTIFASHLDTACKDQVNVTHVFDGSIIKTDKTSILGADDKAGITILLWMMKHNIPGTYYLFIGEEVGCIGSGLASKDTETFKNYDRIISFDRRGTSSVITYQSMSRTCSDEFANALASEINKYGTNLSYKIDDTGVYTDSAEFTGVIPECTNLSVGYYNEHTTSENQDIKHLHNLALSCLCINWEELPTKRDPLKNEFKSYNYDRYSYLNTDGDWERLTIGMDEYLSSEWVRKYKEYPEREESPFIKNRKKSSSKNYSTRRGKGNRKSKTFYSSGGNLVPFKEIEYIKEAKEYSENTNKYEPLKSMFLDTNLTSSEMEIIKEQYLNMNDETDRNCYNVLLNHNSMVF